MARKKRLSIYLTLVFFVASLLLTVVFIGTSFSSENKFLRNQTHNLLIEVRNSRILGIEAFVDKYKQVIRVISAEPTTIELLSADKTDTEYARILNEVNEEIKPFLDIYRELLKVSILDIDGTVVYSTDESDIDSHENEVIAILKSDEIFFEDIHWSKGFGVLDLDLGLPITDESNHVVGGVIIDAGVEELFDITTEREGLGGTGEIYIVNRDLTLITPSRFLEGEGGVLQQIVDTQNVRNCFSMVKTGTHMDHSEITYTPDYRGEDIVGTHDAIPELGWCILIEIDKSEAIDIPLKLILIKDMFIGLIFIIIFTLIGFFIGFSLDKRYLT